MGAHAFKFRSKIYERRCYGAITVAANWALSFNPIGACGSAPPPA